MYVKTVFYVLIMMFLCKGAEAVCTWSGANVAWTVSPGAIRVKYSDPIGTSIFSKKLESVQNGVPLYRCTQGEQGQMNIVSGTPTPGLSNVFTTNIPGIGIKVSTQKGLYFGQPGANSGTDPLIGAIAPLTFEIIKTGPVALGGNLDNIRIFQITLPGVANSRFTGVMGTASILPVNDCTINTPSILVNMGNDIYSSEFKGVGTTTKERDFLIQVTCAQSTRVSITFDGQRVPNNPNILALKPVVGTATGIGIQLLNFVSSAPLPLGSPIAMGTVQVEGSLDLQFKAHYYQTAEKVTGGLAGANADFTMTYN